MFSPSLSLSGSSALVCGRVGELNTRGSRDRPQASRSDRKLFVCSVTYTLICLCVFSFLFLFLLASNPGVGLFMCSCFAWFVCVHSSFLCLWICNWFQCLFSEYVNERVDSGCWWFSDVFFLVVSMWLTCPCAFKCKCCSVVSVIAYFLVVELQWSLWIK